MSAVIFTQYAVLRFMGLDACFCHIYKGDNFFDFLFTFQSPSENGSILKWQIRFPKGASSFKSRLTIGLYRSGYQVNICLISPQKHMLWVLLRSTSVFFWTEKSILSRAMVDSLSEGHQKQIWQLPPLKMYPFPLKDKELCWFPSL